MRRTRQISYKSEIMSFGPLNQLQTVILATDAKTNKQQYIIKVIHLGQQYGAYRPMQESMLKKLYGSNQPIAYKPEFYSFDQDSKCLYLGSHILGVSLENIILFHKYNKKYIDPTIVHDFGCKIYQTLNRIKNSGTEFYHKNLKPSNIFYTITAQSQIEWKLTEFSLLTNYPNKYYQNAHALAQKQQIKSKSNISFMNDQYQSDMHALAVILIEMVTLAPIDQIYRAVNEQRGLDGLEGMSDVSNMYGQEIVKFLKQMLKNKDGVKEVFHQFKDNPPQFGELPKYKQIQFNFQRFNNIIKDQPYKKLIEKFRQKVSQTQITIDQALKMAQKYDPQLDFRFTSCQQFQYFLQSFKISLPFSQLFQIFFFMRYSSGINYIKILQQAYTPADILTSVLKKAIQQYSTRKQFFEAMTGDREFWKADEIWRFLASLGVLMKENDVNDVVREWSGVNKRTSIKYDEFNRLFKGVGNQVPEHRMHSKSKKEIDSERSLYDMLNELAAKLMESNQQNLVNFFRSYDTTNKWIVGPEIQKEIKKRVAVPDKLFKQICQQMWQVAGIVGQNKKVLQYITLLRVKKIYSVTELFKLVLIQKINESNRIAFYRKYQKQSKGWNSTSFIDFNEQEQLDFQQRQLKFIFSELDKDKSNFLNEKQLIFVLTGIQQFDKEYVVEKIKTQMKGKWDLFQLFMRFDKNKDLCFDVPADLMEVFQCLNIQIPAQHCEELFKSGMRKGKFPYMEFLRYFIESYKLFVKACMFYIDQFYSGSFQKFYDLGRVKNKKKWSAQSINFINQELVLGFSYNQIGQIWDQFDPQKEGVLTKQQVAKIFNCSYEPDENILGIDSTQKHRSSQLSSKFQKQQPTRPTKQQQQSPKKDQPPKQSKSKNDLAQRILQKKLPQVALSFIKKSHQNGELNFNDFCSCLDELKIKYLRNAAMKNTSQFQSMDPQSNAMKINFVNFLMYVCQMEEEGKEARKVQCLIPILKELIRYNNITTDEIFKKCKRPGIMKLTDYENFIRDLVKTEVYFDDIQDTWKNWGEPDYLTPDDLNKLLNSSGYDPVLSKKPSVKVARQFSFAQQQHRKSSQNQAESPYFPKKKNQRKQSRDSRTGQISLTPSQTQRNIQSKKQANSNNYPPRKRNSYQQRQKSQLSKYERQKQTEKQKIRQRERKQREDKDSRDREREKEKEKEKERDRDRDRDKEGKMVNKQKQITKETALDQFQNRIKEKGSQKLNQLFANSNAVSTQQFSNFVQVHYDIDGPQCQKLCQALNSFGKVKLQTVKRYIKKIQSPKKLQKPQLKQQSKKQIRERQSVGKKDVSKGKMTKQQKIQKNESLRLEDPRKMRINVPVVKQHIKILIASFTKKYDINEMQPYFFQGNPTIQKQEFIKKCLQIHPSISKSIYQKIFLYLKPKSSQISSVSFKLSFNYDQQVKLQQTYLPQQIQNQIKSIFDKADRDKSGYIQLKQIENILGSLGLNESQREIENYFQRIDRNFDKKISLVEFKMFIEDNILPYVSDFDQDVDGLVGLLKINDVFRTGYLPVVTIGAVLQRYGVKLNDKELNTLNRFIANDNGEISIKQFINFLYYPSQTTNPSSLKAVLYKIRWRRKITFKQIQKIFQNISACFVMSYTSQIIKKRLLTPSSFITPILNESRLFYNDFFYKNFSKLDQKSPNLVSVPRATDLIVEIKMVDASGIPIPQNQSVKNSILNRYINIILFDTSNEEGKDCILTLGVEFDSDIEDQWIFDKNNRSVFVKIANYQARKYEKILVLFEFVITVIDNNKALDISCGTCSFPLRELIVEAKINKKFKIIAGLPNKSKEIDKLSISKRKGWRGFISANQQQSQLQIQILPAAKIQDKLEYICALPQKSIVNRKALHLFWTFRQYFAYKSTDQKRINPDYSNHFLVKTFLLCLDIQDVYQQLIPFWKQKIQPKSQSVFQSKKILHNLLLDMFIIIHSKQFELLPSFISKSTSINKSLKSVRKKLIQEVFSNIQEWVKDDVRKQYKRKRPYAVDSAPFRVEERERDGTGVYGGIFYAKK